MQHFAENELIKSIVVITTENKSKNPLHFALYPTEYCRNCQNSLMKDITIFCGECVFNGTKHNTEKTNLAQVNQVLSHLRGKR